ncbi:MAG TPA: hypothetical protein PLQ54_09955 [Armatimonadota bacterium]|nr:hypothetical protein [Armatimonadota bacterium]
MKTAMKTPTSVADLHASLTTSIPKYPTSSAERIELRFPQKLRAAAAGEVFAACRPAFTEDDEDDLGYVLAQLAGWVLHGEAYDPDITFADELRRGEEDRRA